MSKPLTYINTIANEDKWADMNTAISNMSARVTQAIADLVAGRKVLSDDTVPDIGDRIAQAVADVVSARAYFNKVNISSPETEYLRSASGELSAAMGYLNQSKGYAGDQAIGQLRIAGSYLNQAQGYLSRFNAKTVFAKLSAYYQAWGQSLLAVVMSKVEGVKVPFDRYARGNRQRHSTA
jgi:hypothetical protein